MCTTDALLAFLWVAELHQLHLQFAGSDLELQISAVRALYDILLKKTQTNKQKIKDKTKKKQINKEEGKKK